MFFNDEHLWYPRLHLSLFLSEMLNHLIAAAVIIPFLPVSFLYSCWNKHWCLVGLHGTLRRHMMAIVDELGTQGKRRGRDLVSRFQFNYVRGPGKGGPSSFSCFSSWLDVLSV